MSFAFPGFLWALFSLAIPIIIHLFNFRRVQKIFFSNTRLLKQVKEETTKRRRIKHWLILLSRLLFLFFLVMAFAQPYTPANEQFSSGKNVVLYVDNSYSMSAPMADKTRRLDAATGFASEIINTFPQDTRYKLITNDFAPSSNHFKTKTEIADLLSQIRFSNVGRTIGEIQNKTEPTGQTDIFFLSDFQKSTLGNVSLSDTTLSWRMVPVQSPMISNVYVDSAWFENPYLSGGEKNRLNVWVRNDGKENAEHLSIKLTINNVLAATATLSIPGNGSTTTVFDISANPNQYQELKITIQDFPISFDNEFYLAISPLQRLKIVEVHGLASTKFIEGVYGNRNLFEFKSFPVTNIDFPQLEAADLVVFNELPDFDGPIRQLLASGKIKSHLIIPASQVKISSYQSVVGLPMQYVELPGEKATPKSKEKLSAPDFRNPFFDNVFEDKSSAMEMPTAAKVFQWGHDPSAILKLRDGTPYLSKTSHGYVLASPLQKEFTDFAQHALFVPVMYKMAAMAKQDLQRPYYFLSENFISIPSDSMVSEEPVRLVGNIEIIPSQRYVAGKIFMDVPKFSITSGFYYITTKTDTLGLMAFNLGKDESRLEAMTLAELRKIADGRKNISVFEPGNRQAFGNEIKARYLGEPLWKYCLAFALLFILVEILLIRLLK
jgi:Aerotolerance regulator N-terminal